VKLARRIKELRLTPPWREMEVELVTRLSRWGNLGTARGLLLMV